LVPDIPLTASFFRSSFKARSMVAGLITRSFAWISGVIRKAGQAAMAGIWSRRRGARSCGNFISDRIGPDQAENRNDLRPIDRFPPAAVG
jgi:hypothetical protein